MAFLAIGIGLAVTSGPAGAQGTARSMDIDVSIRSAGMAGASNAVFWGDDLNHWANPALLGYARGVRYEWGRTRLVPGLAADVHLTSRSFKLGGGGFGAVLSGRPFRSMGVDLDYGASEGTDENGNPTGTFTSYERVDSWGFGVSAVRMVDDLLRLGDLGRARLDRHVDLAFGMNFKEARVVLAPFPFGAGGTRARDVGALARVTPLLIEDEDGTSMRLDLAYGWSVLSYNDDAIVTFIAPSPVSRHHRNGFALHVDWNPATWPAPGAGHRGPLLRGFAPLLSLGFATDFDHITAGSLATGHYNTSGEGLEVMIANVVAARVGHYADKTGDIDGVTGGWSVGAPLGRAAGARYEESWFPQAKNSGLRDIHRRAFAVWIDPYAAIRWASGAER